MNRYIIIISLLFLMGCSPITKGKWLHKSPSSYFICPVESCQIVTHASDNSSEESFDIQKALNKRGMGK